MALFDSEDKSQVSDVAYGLDNNGLANGDTSIFSSIGNFVTKGVPLTGLSILNSFANTGIDVTNWLTNGQTERLSVEN